MSDPKLEEIRKRWGGLRNPDLDALQTFRNASDDTDYLLSRLEEQDEARKIFAEEVIYNYDSFKKDIASLTSRVARLEEGLAKYGVHHAPCETVYRDGAFVSKLDKCGCGLDDLLKGEKG